MKHTLKDWVLAVRPWSFPASAMPVMVTVAWMYATGHPVNWWLAAAALVNIVLVHAAGNVWSDYFDYKRGVDRRGTYSVKTLTEGLFTPEEVWRLSVGLQVVAIVLGIGLVLLTGWPLLWIGLAGIALSLLYPPLKYCALGDVVILLCYAFLPMTGTTFIAGGALYWDVLWLAPPVGLITVAILHANNTRDIESDRQAKIRTFSMLIGRGASAWVYAAEVLVPYAWMAFLYAQDIMHSLVLLTWISLPMAAKNAHTMLGRKQVGTAAYARLDEATAQLQLAFSTLLIAGLILGLIIED